MVNLIVDALADGRGGWVVTPNLDHLRRLRLDGQFRDVCRQASLLVADGVPLVWASRMQGTPLPERVAGSNLIFSLTEAAAVEGRSIFLLGGNPGTAEAAADEFRRRYPRIHVAGTYCPPVGFESDAEEMARIRTVLADARPDIVYVALGSPKQERLILQLRELLPQTWWLGVGVSFSFVCGDVRRAPRWMQRVGLEWLHRLCQEPRRLARRYLVHGIPFAAHLFASALYCRVRRRWGGSR
ncbi:MAG: WecB/TagA/CpsF family glycosyltransferase [Planctomycetota bacterium]